MFINLTKFELKQAAMVGVDRRIESIDRGLHSKKFTARTSYWETDIQGAAAEMALAKHLGKYWGFSVNVGKEADLGENMQVRSSAHPNAHLIVRKPDSESDNYILVIAHNELLYEIKGWISGKDAKTEDFWNKDSWWIPQERLNNDISTLPQAL